MRNVTVLNSDWTPLTVISWKKALGLLARKKADVIEIYDDLIYIDTAGREYIIPKTISLIKYAKIPRKSYTPTRNNIFRRDNYTCAYCIKQLESNELSVDHIIPKSRGGLNTWANLVTACKTCNERKADRTPAEAGMLLWGK